MVDIRKLRAWMALRGHDQKSLVAEIKARGKKMSENTLSAKMKGKSKFNCDDADIICEVLGVENDEDKAEIFLA